MREEERLIRSAVPDMGFDSGFRDRVMARVRHEGSLEAAGRDSRRSAWGADTMYYHLRRAFPRVAAAGVIGLIGLGMYALIGGAGVTGLSLDALLGLPPETLETAFALGGV